MTFTVYEAVQLLTSTEELDEHDRLNLARFIEEQAEAIDDLNYERTRLWEDAEYDMYRIRDLENENYDLRDQLDQAD